MYSLFVFVYIYICEGNVAVEAVSSISYQHTSHSMDVKWLIKKNYVTSIAPKSLKSKLRGASKQKGLIDLSVNKQIQFSSD